MITVERHSSFGENRTFESVYGETWVTMEVDRGDLIIYRNTDMAEPQAVAIFAAGTWCEAWHE